MSYSEDFERANPSLFRLQDRLEHQKKVSTSAFIVLWIILFISRMKPRGSKLREKRTFVRHWPVDVKLAEFRGGTGDDLELMLRWNRLAIR